jgi:hypothetical protein
MNKFIILTIIFLSLTENKLFSMRPPHLQKKINSATTPFKIKKAFNQTTNDTEYPEHTQLFFQNSKVGTIEVKVNFDTHGFLSTNVLKEQLALLTGSHCNKIILIDGGSSNCGKIIDREYVTKKEFIERGVTYFIIKKDNSQ